MNSIFKIEKLTKKIKKGCKKYLFCLPFNSYGEFDPGSGWTLGACLTHASRTILTFCLQNVRKVADGWVTRKNLPLGGE